MRNARWFLLAFSLAAVSGAAMADQHPQTEEHAMSPKEREIAKHKAVRGDASASYDLWRYYSMDVGDTKEALFWLKLSAEQGSCQSMIEFGGVTLSTSGDVDVARHWAEKADAMKCGSVNGSVRRQLQELQGFIDKRAQQK